MNTTTRPILPNALTAPETDQSPCEAAGQTLVCMNLQPNLQPKAKLLLWQSLAGMAMCTKSFCSALPRMSFL